MFDSAPAYVRKYKNMGSEPDTNQKSWQNLKKTIIEKVKAKNATKVKINWLKCFKQEEKESALNKNKASNILEENSQQNKSDVKLDSINIIQNVVAKPIKDISKRQNNSQAKRGIIFDNADIHLVEFTEKGPMTGNKYLKIELLNENGCCNIRLFGKRKRKNAVSKTMQPIRKRRKVKETICENGPRSCENIMYIPFVKLSDKLDLLKKLSNMKVILIFRQLFKWFLKACSKIIKDLTWQKKDNNDQNAPIDSGSRINLMLKNKYNDDVKSIDESNYEDEVNNIMAIRRIEKIDLDEGTNDN
ncbi:20583_t:CDS:2 [Cetraspora pellucida]|uniref:20583_t:CDS:1 n=1 Tax=Cetraspora pellucida TaxID=1433469 RepID=A0A9N9EK57_9GLOM|nr:20583_t:CDS:2 [Cetraspora pellucida]